MRELLGILAAARRQWPWMVAGIALSVVVIVANSLLMAVSGWFIASMAVAGSAGLSFNYFMPSAAIRGLAILRTVGRYAERLVTHEATLRVVADLRVWLFRRLEPLAPAVLERYAGGDVAGRLRADVDAVEVIYLRILAPIAAGSISILLGVAFLACWSITTALVLFGFLVAAGVALPLVIHRMAAEPGQRSTALAAELRREVTEGLQGMEELILLGAMERQAHEVNELSGRLIAEQQRLGRTSGFSAAGSVACSGLAMAGILMVAGQEVTSGTLSGPLLVMALLFSAALFEAAVLLPAALQQLPGAREAVRRIRILTDAPLPVTDPLVPVEVPVTTGIIFRHVTSAHNPETGAEQEFDLEIPSGSCTALVGPSGSGKSTIMEILLRFREYGGIVTVGDVDIRSMSGDELRGLISALPQRPHLFNSSIRDNLLVARPEATDDELGRAVADAGLSDWVARLPMGLDTLVGEEGSAVSGGEAKRIALARALLKDAPIMLLDEPTEGLDSVTEQDVVNRLQERLKGKTVLLATHRPACLTLAEQVVHLFKPKPFKGVDHTKPRSHKAG